MIGRQEALREASMALYWAVEANSPMVRDHYWRRAARALERIGVPEAETARSHQTDTTAQKLIRRIAHYQRRGDRYVGLPSTFSLTSGPIPATLETSKLVESVMSKEHFRVVAIDETLNWSDEVLARHHIGVAYGIYLIREGERTFCASMTPDSWAVALSNEFLFTFDLDPSLRPQVIDEHLMLVQAEANQLPYYWRDPLDAIRQIPYDEGLGCEALEDSYLQYIDPERFDFRFITDRITFTFKARDYKGGTKGDEYRKAIWDEATEYYQGNVHHPAILCPPVYLQWEGEQIQRTRAVNKPLLPVSFRDDNLPLFAAAAKRMKVSEVVQMGWLGQYTKGYFETHPDELAAADARGWN